MSGRVKGHKGPGAFSFQGRAGRGEFVGTFLWCVLIAALVGSAPLVGALLALPWVLMSLAVQARRLHDLGLSGWVMLTPIALFGVWLAVVVWADAQGLTVAEPGAADASTPWTEGIALAFSGLALLQLAYLGALAAAKGKDGPNMYGEADPA